MCSYPMSLCNDVYRVLPMLPYECLYIIIIMEYLMYGTFVKLNNFKKGLITLNIIIIIIIYE